MHCNVLVFIDTENQKSGLHVCSLNNLPIEGYHFLIAQIAAEHSLLESLTCFQKPTTSRALVVLPLALYGATGDQKIVQTSFIIY